ncbi:MAG: sugar ABC transporter ATP-binding protein [Chloroflexota bacterium]|nr:sugar ABC transporter ATP-binding protein [Chloroflexota bacterium]MDE2947699.1 sugar ABC transporter ATP-binding protein [Chloroflexota bacterium]
MNDVLLELSGIDKVFPGVRALKDAQFDVRRGEVHALIGENGAGKSTLIKIVSGVYQPDSGEIRLAGAPVEFSNPREAHSAGIATIYQELGLYPELSVAENIFMGHAPTRKRLGFETIDWEQMEAGAEALLADLNIHNLDVGAKVGALNVGNRQRVEIAKALSLNAQILIMDEPTAALTESDVEQLFSIVRLLRERGVSIIYISHRLNEVFELADRVTVLRDGEYIGTHNVADTSEAELISMMVGRRIENLFPKQAAQIGEVVLDVRNLNRPPLTRDVSFTVRAGEIVGLAGLVGSGRSETAQVIFGVLPAEAGEIRLNGEAVKITRPSEAVDYGIGYVPEDRGHQGLIREMTIRENTSMAVLESVSNYSFVNRAKERTLANRAIQQLSIRATGPDQTANKLSGGNQQKVVVSKWLASNPKLLIMDEPTRGIDVGAKAEIHRLMSRLAAEDGLAILMISSELPEILAMSDRILVMREGRLVGEFSREEATQEIIAHAMMSASAVGGAREGDGDYPAPARSIRKGSSPTLANAGNRKKSTSNALGGDLEGD